VAGRHRDTAERMTPRRFPAVVPVVAGALALTVLAGVGAYAMLRSKDRCRGRIPLNVLAAPDIAPVLARIGDTYTRSERKVEGDLCIAIRVASQPSATVAAVVSGAEVGRGPLPDVWVPDSSLWVDQARAGAQLSDVLPPDSTSIASSPTVIAAPVPIARQLAAGGDPSWRDLLRASDSERQLRIGFPDPLRNTTGLAALLALGQVTRGAANDRTRQAAVARKLSQAAADDVSDLFNELPKTPDEAALAAGIAAFPTTEQSVWKYNNGRPAVPLRALYPAEGGLRLDYPFVVLRYAPDPKRITAVSLFLEELRGEAGRQELQASGFRAADGEAGAALSADTGVRPQPPKAGEVTPPQAVSTVLKSWQALNLPARMLVAIDISGSMGQVIPGVNKTRLQIAIAAAQQGLGLVGDNTEMGLWVFSTQLDGDRDYKQVIAPGPLSGPAGASSRRAALADAATSIQAVPNGSTGLYDTVRAVHRIAVEGYQPNKVNSVLIYTDGKNSDPTGGISLEGLLAELRRADPQKPVPVFMIGFGPDADMDSARKIAAATKGQAFNVNSVEQITSLFVGAIGQRLCRPNC
jgi:Bacterial extracellular solute-binding protein/von Willebrand factor type A domain